MGVKVKEKTAGSGVWWVFINHNGRRKSRMVGTERAAKKVAELIQARLKLGQSALPEERRDTPTLDQYYKKFEKNYLDTAVRQSTSESYESNFRLHISPALGSFRLDEITRERIKDFVADLVIKKPSRTTKPIQREKTRDELPVAMERTLSRPTIRIILAELCAVLNHALEDGVLKTNPATRLGKLYRKAAVLHEEIEPLTHAEVPKFLQAVMERSREYYPLFLCAIHTGLRSGELAGLQWGDIDFNGKFLTVRRNVVNGRVQETKTDKSRRRVDLSDELLTALTELNRRRKEESLGKGSNEIPEWVFCNEMGKPADMHNVKNRHFYKALEKARLRRIRFHDLRHTFASLLIQNGESLAYVKDQLPYQYQNDRGCLWPLGAWGQPSGGQSSSLFEGAITR